MVNDSPIAWHSGYQSTVSLSTYESEYMAMSAGVQHSYLIKWLKDDINQMSSVIHTFTDNEKLVQSLQSGSILGSRRVRHLLLNCAWLREKMGLKEINVSHIKGVTNYADIFTKPLPKPAFEKHCTKLLHNLGSTP